MSGEELLVEIERKLDAGEPITQAEMRALVAAVRDLSFALAQAGDIEDGALGRGVPVHQLRAILDRALRAI